jgi:D-3-phosphoglycerate dehydrogenase
VRGAVLHANSLRLLGVDNIGIEVPLEGNLIYIRNRDVPGVVGKVGSLLGQHHVNIAHFALGRIGPDADAIAVVQVDAPAPEAVLQKLRELAEIQEVCTIQL